jgi:hypothetical protein
LPLLGPSSESERIQSRTLVSGIGFTPLPLGPSSVICLPLRCHLAGMRADPVAAPLRVPVLLDPGCAGSFAAWPLAGAHRRLCLHASSHASSALFFIESVSLIHLERRRGWLNIHFAPFDFYKSYLTIHLIPKICENVEIIMIDLKYIL